VKPSGNLEKLSNERDIFTHYANKYIQQHTHTHKKRRKTLMKNT